MGDETDISKILDGWGWGIGIGEEGRCLRVCVGYGYGYDMGKLVLYVRLVTSRAYDGDMWRT
jgi:hypothetical protein